MSIFKAPSLLCQNYPGNKSGSVWISKCTSGSVAYVLRGENASWEKHPVKSVLGLRCLVLLKQEEVHIHQTSFKWQLTTMIMCQPLSILPYRLTSKTGHKPNTKRKTITVVHGGLKVVTKRTGSEPNEISNSHKN